MLVHGRIDCSSVNGPGNRAVLHFQGCSLNCPGCWNPDTHAFHERTDTPLEDICQWLLGLKGIEGVTFSGGEPMQHFPDLYMLVYFLREHRPELSLGMFTGYTLSELETSRWKWHSRTDGGFNQGSAEMWAEIRSRLDFAVMGRYNQTVQSKDLPMCGSSNQRVVFFSDRYSEKDLAPQAVEVEIDPENQMAKLTGFPVGINPEEILGVEVVKTKQQAAPKLAGKPRKASSPNDDDGEDLVSA